MTYYISEPEIAPSLRSNFGDPEIRACWQKAADADVLNRADWLFSAEAYAQLLVMIDSRIRTVTKLYGLEIVVSYVPGIWFGIRVRAQ